MTSLSPICSKKSEATTLNSGLVANLSFLCCVLIGCSCCGLLLLLCVLFFAVGFSFLLVFSESQMSTQVPNGTNNWQWYKLNTARCLASGSKLFKRLFLKTYENPPSEDQTFLQRLPHDRDLRARLSCHSRHESSPSVLRRPPPVKSCTNQRSKGLCHCACSLHTMNLNLLGMDLSGPCMGSPSAEAVNN